MTLSISAFAWRIGDDELPRLGEPEAEGDIPRRGSGHRSGNPRCHGKDIDERRQLTGAPLSVTTRYVPSGENPTSEGSTYVAALSLTGTHCLLSRCWLEDPPCLFLSPLGQAPVVTNQALCKHPASRDCRKRAQEADQQNRRGPKCGPSR